MVEKLNRSAKPNRLAQRVPGLTKSRELYPTQIPSSHPQIEGDLPTAYSDFVTDEYDNLQLETHPLNLLFFLKKVDDEEIMESMNSCVRYILEK